MMKKLLHLFLAALLLGGPALAAVGDPVLVTANAIVYDNTSLVGDVTGTIGATVVGDDSHSHTMWTLSGIDISMDTNLAVTAPVVLTNDTLSLNQNAGTDVTANLEEEGEINASAVTGNAIDDQVLLGSGSNALAYATIPDCVGDNMLTYTQATNTFGCDPDDGAAGSGIAIASPEALTIATGAVTLTGAANTITYHTIETESAAASDDLDTINCTAGSEHVIYPVNAARTVVVKAALGFSGADFSMDNDGDRLVLHCPATNTVRELARANNGA